MANELLADSSFGLEFKPAELKMTNYDSMKEVVQNYADKYKGLVFTRDEKSGASEARSELLSLKNAIDSERKNVKRVYNEPLNEFEQKLRDLISMIDEPLDDIRDGLKEIDEAEREERENALNALLKSKLEDTNITIDDLETDDRWLNKGSWTSKMNPIKKTESEIDSAIEKAVKEKERRENEIRILTEFCKAQDIEPAGWISQLEHRSAMEVIDLINLEKDRKERLAAEQEQKRKQHEEYLAKQQEEQVGASEFAEHYEEDKELDEFSPDLPDQTEKVSNVIRVTGTVSQLQKLNEFLVTSGINVELVEEKEDYIDLSEDDLPW